MKKNIVNFDYEKVLFDVGKPFTNFRCKLNREFEYLYFFIEEEVTELVNQRGYSDDYLFFIEWLGLTIPHFVEKDDQSVFWTGSFDHIEEKRQLNHKFFTYELAQKYGWGIEGEFIGRCLPKDKQDQIYLAKKPTSFSGIGHQKIDRHADLESDHLISPLHNFKVNISANLIGNEVFITENFIENFSFKGGVVTHGIHDYLHKVYSIDLNEFKFNEIINYVNDHFKTNEFGIDGAVTEDNRYISLLEINARKTMAWQLAALRKFLKENYIGHWYFTPGKKLKKSFSLDELKRLFDQGILITSPEGCQFLTFFIQAKGISSLNQVLKKFVEEFVSP